MLLCHSRFLRHRSHHRQHLHQHVAAVDCLPRSSRPTEHEGPTQLQRCQPSRLSLSLSGRSVGVSRARSSTHQLSSSAVRRRRAAKGIARMCQRAICFARHLSQVDICAALPLLAKDIHCRWVFAAARLFPLRCCRSRRCLARHRSLMRPKSCARHLSQVGICAVSPSLAKDIPMSAPLLPLRYRPRRRSARYRSSLRSHSAQVCHAASSSATLLRRRRAPRSSFFALVSRAALSGQISAASSGRVAGHHAGCAAERRRARKYPAADVTIRAGLLTR